MSDLADAARVQVLLADYANTDASEKINALGAGFQVSGSQPNGFTAPQTLVAILEFPPGHAGDDCAVEFGLYDEAGKVVLVPSPTGDVGQPLRFGQNITIQQPVPHIPGLKFPKGSVWHKQQIVAAFPSGLLLAVGQAYEWRITIDGTTKPDWWARFYLPAPAGPLVQG